MRDPSPRTLRTVLVLPSYHAAPLIDAAIGCKVHLSPVVYEERLSLRPGSEAGQGAYRVQILLISGDDSTDSAYWGSSGSSISQVSASGAGR